MRPRPARITFACATTLALVLCLVACGGNGPSGQANEVAAALEGLATDPVALVSSKASAEARDQVAQLFVPGSKVSPDVGSWAPDGPDKGTMVVTVEPPDQDPQIITVIVEYEDSTWKITEIVPEEPPVSPSDPPETGLSLNPIVFESIGQPPDVVEQKAGKMRNAYYSEGVFFEFGEYTFEFSDFTGDLDGEDMGPNGICTGFLGELHQIIDGATDLISIADLEALFGQAVEKIEPAQTIRGGAELGGIRYKQHGISVAIYYSAASGDDFFSSRDQVAVYLDSR